MIDQVADACYLYIGEYDYEITYMTDIPRDFLKAMIFALKEDNDFCVWVDCDYEACLKIVSDYFDTYLIIGNELTVIKDFNKWHIAMEIYDDFREDFDDWCNWQCYKSPDESEDYPESFINLLDTLSSILQKPGIYLQNTERYGSRQAKVYEQLGIDRKKTGTPK